MTNSLELFNFEPVTATDEVAAAVAAAHARVATVYGNKQPKTLLDNLTAEEFANWDGSDEIATVMDKDGIEENDISISI